MRGLEKLRVAAVAKIKTSEFLAPRLLNAASGHGQWQTERVCSHFQTCRMRYNTAGTNHVVQPHPMTRPMSSSSLQMFQHRNGNGRPVVVLIGWLFAKPKHLYKYKEFYMDDHGFDVITVPVHVQHVFSPRRAQRLAESILDKLATEAPSRDVLFHTFSVGGYIYGETLVKLLGNSTKYANIIRTLRGTIYDSPVDYNGIPVGVAKATTRNAGLQKVLQGIIHFLMSSRRIAEPHYLKASKAFHDNDLRLPGMFLYSLSDPVCEPEKFEKIVTSWHVKNIDAESNYWHDALHVSVYSKYPDEYMAAIERFLNRLGINPQGKHDVAYA